MWWTVGAVLVLLVGLIAWMNRYEYPSPRLRVNRFTGCTEIFGRTQQPQTASDPMMQELQRRFAEPESGPQVAWRKTNC